MSPVRSALCLGVSMGALLGAVPAMAQSAPNDAAAVETGGLADIVVTARRVSESAQKVPLAITTLPAEVLRDATVKSIRDLQGTAPALFISTGTGGASAANVGIRGQTQADTLLVTDPSVAVYLDEVNLPRQIGLRAAFLDLDQIEVLKGPQGTLFGKNTTGGALLLRTKRPSLTEVGGYVNALAAEHGTIQATGAVSIPVVTDMLGVRVAVQKSERDGFGRSGAGIRTNDQDDFTIRGSALFKPTETVQLFVSADKTRVRQNGSNIRVASVNPSALFPTSVKSEIARELGLDPTVAANRETAYQAFVQQATNADGFYGNNGTAALRANLDLSGYLADLRADIGTVTFRSITGYRTIDRDDLQDYDASRFIIVQPNNFQRDKSFTQEVQLHDNSGGALEWIVGGFYSHEKGDEGSITPQLPLVNPASPNFQDGTVKNVSYAGFAQADYSITDQLKFTGGFRWTEITQNVELRNRSATGCVIPATINLDLATGGCRAHFNQKFSEPSYLASLDFQVAPTILVYAKTSSSFRAGGVNTRGSSNPDSFALFAPEKATDYEIGFKGDLLDRKLRINAAAFYTDYTGIQRSQTRVVNNQLLSFVTNAASAKIYGAELEVTARPVEALTLSGSFNWTHARYKKFNDAVLGDRSKEPFAIPEYQFSVSGKYVIPAGPGDLSLFAAYRWQDDVTYRGEALFPATTMQKAYGLLEGRLAYKVEEPGAEISLFVKNALDKKYYTNFLTFDRNQLGYNIGFTGEPRTIGVELRFAFGGG